MSSCARVISEVVTCASTNAAQAFTAAAGIFQRVTPTVRDSEIIPIWWGEAIPGPLAATEGTLAPRLRERLDACDQLDSKDLIACTGCLACVEPLPADFKQLPAIGAVAYGQFVGLPIGREGFIGAFAQIGEVVISLKSGACCEISASRKNGLHLAVAKR